MSAQLHARRAELESELAALRAETVRMAELALRNLEELARARLALADAGLAFGQEQGSLVSEKELAEGLALAGETIARSGCGRRVGMARRDMTGIRRKP